MSPQDAYSGIMGLIIIAVGIAIYFYPAYIAHKRKKANAGAILALNLLLGWTFIGWVVALVWALTVEKPEPSAR